MKSRAILQWWTCLPILVLEAAACRPPVKPGRPVWLVARQSRQYPASEYLVGTAIGASLDEAVAAARADLIGALEERLSMELEVRGPKLRLAGKAVLGPAVVDELASEPAGLETALTWSSAAGKRHAAMVVVAREELATAAREQIGAWEQQGLELLTRAKARTSREPYAAAMDLIATIQLRVQAEKQRALLAAISRSEPPPARGPGLGELAAQLEHIRAGIRLQAAAGNGLAVRADAKDVGLVLSADFKQAGLTTPVQNLPVRFELPPGGGERLISARVDPAGMAHVRIASVEAFAGRRLEVTARLDGQQILRDAGVELGDASFAGLAERLSEPETRFELTVTDSRAGRVALIIAETRSGEFEDNSHLAAGLAQALTQAGFNVIDFDELDVELPAEPTPVSMAAVVAGKADFLVYGVADAQLDKKIAAGLVFVRIACQLVAVRVPSGQVLAELKPSAKAPGRDLDSAANRACDKAVRAAARSITEALTGSKPVSEATSK